MRRVTVTATEAAWKALLAAFPRCADSPCSAPAEVTLDGIPLCASCVGSRDRGVLVELPHGTALAAIEAALSPFEPEGTWSE